MKNKRKLTIGYLKYVVKSPIIFYGYIFGYLALLGWMTNAVSVDCRIPYNAIAEKGQILVINETEIELLDNRVYVYTDKNEAVETLVVSAAEYEDGIMSFILAQEQEIFSGTVTVEIVTEKSTLFHKIFSEVDRTR